MKKAHPMETRHIKMTPRKSNKTGWWPIDDRPLITREEIIKNLKFYRRWNTDAETRSMYARSFKNGAEVFDLVVAIENSPLMRALA